VSSSTYTREAGVRSVSSAYYGESPCYATAGGHYCLRRGAKRLRRRGDDVARLGVRRALKCDGRLAAPKRPGRAGTGSPGPGGRRYFSSSSQGRVESTGKLHSDGQLGDVMKGRVLRPPFTWVKSQADRLG